jgi:hypothetical protein
MSAWKTRNLLPRWNFRFRTVARFSIRLRIDSTVEGPRGAITSKYERYKSALLTREIQILVSYSSGILTSAAAGIQVPKCIGRGLQTAFLQCRPLTASATRGDWSKELLRDLLWARKEYAHPDTRGKIAQLLLEWPAENFVEIAPAASSWLDEHAKSLDDLLLGRCGIG